MAQLILSRAGAALGARAAQAGFGAAWTQIGRMAGGAIGQRIDDALFGVTRHSEGPRQAGLHVQTSTEGASMPNLYGRMRLAGQVIWAARFKEQASTERSGGGKSGAPRQSRTTYSYSISFAVGLCEGVIAGIDRVWANGQPLDLSQVAMRVHVGAADQEPDPVIEAIEGADRAPAYRDLAYAVFEDLPLEPFGGAIPQLTFEVVRPAPNLPGPARLEQLARGVCLIPGAGEFALATTIARRQLGPGEETAENAHSDRVKSDLIVSLDQLQRDLPAVESVLLVVGWFGDDLRCGHCTIAPRIDNPDKQTAPQAWRVAGVTRSTARVVSPHGGGPAYGGTPSDESVVEAIAEIKRRGLKVGLYPFLFMDIPATNTLPDPYGGAAQAAYPWRGRITPHPAIGRPGAVDKTSAAASQINDFFGAAAAADFSVQTGGVTYSGPATWRYRRFILHYAALAAAAGGVDAFVIGSELKALTRARATATTFPAVSALAQLAQDVRGFLPAPCVLTYGADWSEYGAYAPGDGSGDVLFPLDDLWASVAIDAVGLDWYPPLSDWRDTAGHLDESLSRDGQDHAYLASRIAGGENFDWFYASDEARASQSRAPITDTAHGEHWVFRAKDLRGWWSNAHFPRPGGARASTPTAWAAQSKPIWLIELGCPAVDKGANAPNVFVDPKSAESVLPFFSSGGRDDVIQRRTLEAYLRHFANPTHNPISSVYGAPMVAPGGAHLWCWDARPYPAFPARADVWSDGDNWRLGHWLNGRAGGGDLGCVIADICARAGVSNIDVGAVRGVVAGYVIDAPSTARAGLEPLLSLYGLDMIDSAGMLRFAHYGAAAPLVLSGDDLVDRPGEAISVQRGDPLEAPIETRLRYIDPAKDWGPAMASAQRRDAAGAAGVATLDAPLALDAETAETIARHLQARTRAERETARIHLPSSRVEIEPGDRLILAPLGDQRIWRVTRIEDGADRALALCADIASAAVVSAPAPPAAGAEIAQRPRPMLHILDLPPLPNTEETAGPFAAVFAAPWGGPYDLLAGETASRARLVGTATTAATIGVLKTPLPPGPAGRWLEGQSFEAEFSGAELSAAEDAAVLDGANAFAVRGPGGGWEILQAARITLVAPRRYRFARLLRAQQGTRSDQGDPTPEGSPIVALNAALAPLTMSPAARDAALTWFAVGQGLTANDPDAGQANAVWAMRAAKPFAPVNLAGARQGDGAIVLSWTRCARIGGDPWGPVEPPQEPGGEAYRVEVRVAGALKRVWTAAAASLTYGAAEQNADFAGPAGAFTLRVAQISAVHGIGDFGESAIAV